MAHHVQNENVTLHYDVAGPADAPPLLLINSIASTRDLWARQLPALSAGYRVITYDARGHGESTAPPGEYTLAQLGQDALAVLDAAGAHTAHVCGISLGGMTAQWMGVHAPERVAGLVLANTAARIGTVESWNERIAIVREKGMSAVAEMTIPRWFSPELRERDPDTVHAFRAMIQGTPVAGYLGCCAALRDADLREEVAAIQCPTLVIASTDDVATAPEGLAYIRDRVAGARMVTVNSRHLSNIECAEAFTAAVLDFLGDALTNRGTAEAGS